jgi:hypothetical protein
MSHKRNRNKTRNGPSNGTNGIHKYVIECATRFEMAHTLSPRDIIEIQRVANRAHADAVSRWLKEHIDGAKAFRDDIDRTEYVIFDGPLGTSN